MQPMLPPQAIDYEESILGTSLISREHYETIKAILVPEHFYSAKCRAIYKLILKTDTPDIISVGQALKDVDKYEEYGGTNYLIELTNQATYNLSHCIDVVLERYKRRTMIAQLTNSIGKLYDLQESLSAIQDDVHNASTDKDIDTGFTNALEIIEREKHRPKAEQLLTGYDKLDNGILQHGMVRGRTMLTLADSGHGKTQFSMFIAEKLIRRGYKVGWFQLEGLDADTANYMHTISGEYAKNIWISDSIMDIEGIKRQCRIMKREIGLDYVVIDYIQNVTTSRRNMRKAEMVEMISQELTNLGKELSVVMNPLSQVTMDYDKRPGWKGEPHSGDVRWSQQIKQDASLILSVFRPAKVESLVKEDPFGNVTVLNWKQESVSYNSVFVKQVKNRFAEQDWRRLHLIQGELGLQLTTNMNQL